MKKIFFLLLVLFVQLTLSAQDKIITTSGDTILCRIVSVSNGQIVYEQQVGNHISGKIISLSDVAEYFRGQAKQLSNEIYISQLRTPAPAQPWLLSLSVGGAYLPWLLENVTGEYAENDDYKKLNKGFALNANAHYLITNHVGFGVHYSFFTSGYKSNFPLMIDSYYPTYTKANSRDRQYVNYAGLSVVFRQFLDENSKFSLSQTLSGGLLFYRAESQNKIFFPGYYGGYGYGGYGQFQYVSENALITGDTFGATVGISAEYKILPYLSVGVGGNFMYGKLSKASIEYKNSFGNTEKATNVENPLNLSRIDYSLVLRFQL